MARKNRPILYEVAKNKAAQQAKRTPARPPAPDPPPATPKPAAPTPPPEARVTPAPAPAPKPQPVSQGEKSPLKGGPIKSPDEQAALASFEPNSTLQFWVLTGAGAVVLIFIAFALGQRFSTPSRPAQPAEQPEETTVVSENPVVVEQQPTPQPEPEVIPVPPGYHYVLVQFFPKSKRDAANAAYAFLQQNGVNTAILEGVDLRLIVVPGFKLDDPDASRARTERRAADRLVARVKKLGGEYKRIGGYDFSGASLMKMGKK